MEAACRSMQGTPMQHVTKSSVAFDGGLKHIPEAAPGLCTSRCRSWQSMPCRPGMLEQSKGAGIRLRHSRDMPRRCYGILASQSHHSVLPFAPGMCKCLKLCTSTWRRWLASFRPMGRTPPGQGQHAFGDA